MKKLKIDFGSGYNSKNYYKTCDITFSPILDYHYDQTNNVIIGLKENSVDEFYLRNVIHHLPNIEKTFFGLDKYLKKGGILRIIDVREKFFPQNYFLDRLWYRFIVPRDDIWFSKNYRDYKQILKNMNYRLIHFYNIEEKEVSVWKKL